jgi:hypothetical protein
MKNVVKRPEIKKVLLLSKIWSGFMILNRMKKQKRNCIKLATVTMDNNVIIHFFASLLTGFNLSFKA